MSCWGISPNAPDKEKLKSEFADYVHGLNSTGEISYGVYSELFDAGMELLDRMYELGISDAPTVDAVPGWISVEDRLPDIEEKTESIYDMDTLAEIDVKYHMVSNLVLVAVTDENGDCFVSDDVLVDGKWANYPFPEWEITHWMPLPNPPGAKMDSECGKENER